MPVLLACLGYAGSAAADTVMLRNGDRLSGTITHLSPDQLTLDTDWGGELKIDRGAIASFETEGEVEWSPYRGAQPRRASFAQVASVGQVTLVDDQGAREVPMTRVALINPRPEETAGGVARQGRVTASISWSEGNSEAERIWAEAELSARALSWRSELRLGLRRERDGGQTTADNWLASGKHDRFSDPENFRYVRGSIERDRFKDLTLRGAVGGGFGLQLLDNERTQLSLRGGLDLVTEEWSVDEDRIYTAAGWGINFEHRTSLFDAELFHEQEGFWDLQDRERMTLRSRTGVRMPVAQGLTASLQVNLDWEREPSPGRRSTDATWLIGLGYVW